MLLHKSSLLLKIKREIIKSQDSLQEKKDKVKTEVPSEINGIHIK